MKCECNMGCMRKCKSAMSCVGFYLLFVNSHDFSFALLRDIRFIIDKSLIYHAFS